MKAFKLGYFPQFILDEAHFQKMFGKKIARLEKQHFQGQPDVLISDLLDISSNDSELAPWAEQLAEKLLGTYERREQLSFSYALSCHLSPDEEYHSLNGVNWQAVVSALWAGYDTCVHQHVQGVLNLLLVGVKHWRLENPLAAGNTIEITQRAGDCLWLPPGWYHSVHTSDGFEVKCSDGQKRRFAISVPIFHTPWPLRVSAVGTWACGAVKEGQSSYEMGVGKRRRANTNSHFGSERKRNNQAVQVIPPSKIYGAFLVASQPQAMLRPPQAMLRQD